MKPRIGITGMGIISSIGKNVEEFQESLRTGKCGIGRITTGEGPLAEVNIGAEIKNLSFETMLQPYKAVAFSENFIRNVLLCAYTSPPGVQVSVLAALEAWTQAQLAWKPVRPDRLGIIAAGSNLSQNYHYGLLPKFQKAPQYLTPKYSLHYMDTDHVGTISEIFKIQGEGFTVGGSSASGNAAIIKGYQLIQLDIVDACVVVGAMADLSPMELQGYVNVGAMGGKHFKNEPEKACRPFDRDHEGFIYGQAGACLVLESFASAGKREIPILAEILSGSLVLDGNRLPNPSEEGEARAMKSALGQAGINARDVDYLNTHGTSSPLGDETEIKAIKQVFIENISDLWINSSKGLTGHCLTAAGVIEGIAAIIQMQEGFVHPNLNLENPIDNECRFTRQESVPTPLNISMSNSFGFGGINTSIIFKKGH